jgi:hypothetical protein
MIFRSVDFMILSIRLISISDGCASQPQQLRDYRYGDRYRRKSFRGNTPEDKPGFQCIHIARCFEHLYV